MPNYKVPFEGQYCPDEMPISSMLCSTSIIWIPDTLAWPPTERALSQRPRRYGRLSESSWLSPSRWLSYLPLTRLTCDRSRRARSLQYSGEALQ
eukprot:6210276-Pleurochrysis_carterae.AAC.1